MATQVQFRGGTTTEHSSFNGAAREVTVDTTKQTVVVQDGSTNGGFPLLGEKNADNVKVHFGGNGTTDAGDLQIFHDGDSSYIEHTTTGTDLVIDAKSPGDDLILRAADDVEIRVQGNEDAIKCIGNGAVSLYNDGSPKLSTSSTGVSITGAVESSTLNSASGTDLTLNAGGANRDVFLKVNGTTVMTAQGSTGKVLIGADGTSIKSNQLYFASSGDAYIDHSTNDTDIIFRVSNSTDGALGKTPLILKSSGRCGIGTLTPSAPLHIVGSDNNTTLLVESTDSDANVGPIIELFRNSSTPADNDALGRIDFKGEDNAGNASTFARIAVTALDELNNSEDGRIDFTAAVADTFTPTMSITGGKCGIGTTDPGSLLELNATTDTAQLKFLRTGTTIGGTINTRDESGSKGLTYTAQDGNSAVPQHCFKTDDGSSVSERFRITQDGTIHVNSADSASGGRLYANSSAMYIQDGNGRQTFKVSDPGAGNSITWELNSSGNLVVPSTYGIDFQLSPDIATGESTSSQILDDYEEGTYVPTVNSNLTLNSTYERWSYTKIGRQVTIRGLFLASAVSGTDAVSVSLPFASANLTGATSNAGGQGTMANGVTGATAGVASYVGVNDSNMRFYILTETSGWARMANNDISVGTSEIYFSHTYFAD